MAIVPNDTRFIGISPSVDLTERKSAKINKLTEPYTMQDIADSAGGGGVWGGITGTLSSQTDLQSALDAKQATLISATNIKTVNGTTILGSGDIVAGGKFVDGTDILDAVYTTGNVGIGTVTPSEALDVVGKISLNDGGNSVFVGEDAGLNDDGTNNRNVGVGKGVLQYNTTGAYNIATGHGALQNSTTGSYNVASGYGALQNNSTGDNNVANGFEALFYNSTGYNNTSNGYTALKNNSTGNSNTATGHSSLLANTSGTGNTATGLAALGSNTTGYHNVANGVYSLYLNTAGLNNVANGYAALYNNTTGDGNVANGQSSLGSNTTGNSNVAIGMFAGNLNILGSGNVFLGAYAGESETGSNTLYIANTNTSTPLIHGNFAASELTFNVNNLNFSNIPTSNVGLVAGDVWRSGNDLKIV